MSAVAAGGAINVRMYNVGFGDAFLIKIPTSEGWRKVLFDCGSIASGTAGDGQGAASIGIRDVVASVIADVKDSDGVPRIDVIVATHRHRDHVSGFADPSWKDVHVQEVWMPWTEDPRDVDARRIRDAQSRLAVALDASLKRKLAAVPAGAPAVSELAGAAELASNALSNDQAMFTLHEGFGGRPRRRFLPEREPAPASFDTEALPGVRVHVMGPSHDQDIIRDMDPPAGRGYLRLVDAAGLQTSPEPFDDSWWVEPSQYEASHLSLNPQDQRAMDELNADVDPAVAVSLDKAVNGTSLMVMLQLGTTYLLWPGDAQWGTWQAALRNPQWWTLLKRTRFLKVGHHGSHNATPREFVEETIDGGFLAMASTKTVANWPNIPRGPLLDALVSHGGTIVRSDMLGSAPAPFRADPTGRFADADIPV